MLRALNRTCRRTLMLGGLLAVGACATLGPDFQEPEVQWLSQWQPDFYGQLDTGAQGGAQDLDFWWSVFDDEKLNQLIELARLENRSLRLAGLRIMESRALMGIAGAGMYPQLQQISGSATDVRTRERGESQAQESRNYVGYQAGLTVAWELDFWGRFRRSIESAEAGFLASIANQQDAQVLLAAQAADLYYAYRTTQLRIDIARKNAAIQERSFEITERLYKSGQNTELDLQQAKTQYLATLATIPALQRSLTINRNALCALLGRPPGDLSELVGAAGDLPVISPLAIQDIPARLLMRRPDVRLAAWQVAGQSAQIGVAKAEYFPAISLFGSLAWSGSSSSASPDTGSFQVGPAATWNIFDYGRIKNNVRLQDARLQQSLENYQITVLRAAREIDDAAIGVVKTREQGEVLKSSLEAAERALDLANTLYYEGYADFQRVLDAQRTLFAQSENELINRGDHISAVIALFKALGGGWLDSPVQDIIPKETRDAMGERTNWGDLLTEPLPGTGSYRIPEAGISQHE